MKKLLLLISVVALLAICLVGCGCNNGEVELNIEIEYELTEDQTGYKVVGISTNKTDTPLSEITIPSTYKGLNVKEIESVSNASAFLSKINLPGTIEKIADSAFLGCSKLSSINIPDNVSYIGSHAFKDCSLLASVNIPSGVSVINEYTFSGCSSLDEIIIPSNVVEIKSYAFCKSSLDKITVPDTVLKLGEGIFYECVYLSEAVLPNHLAYVPSSTFAKCKMLKKVTFNEDIVTVFEEASFMGCSILKDMSLKSIVKIGKDALLGCTLMTEKFDGIYYCKNWIVNIDNEQVIDRVVISDTVFGIGDGALSGGLMTELVIPDTVKIIGDNALSSMPNLKSIQIGSGVENIGVLFLYDCQSLETIDVSLENQFFKSVENCLYTNDQKTLIKYNTGSLEDVFTVPSTVEVIEKYAFAYANLKEIILPSTLKSVLAGSFENCENLNKVQLPDSIAVLEEKVFYNCKSLKEVVIPVSILEIGYSLFAGCESLESAEIKGQITKIDSYAFENCISLKEISIPQSTEYIGIASFRGCVSLTNVHIPKNVSKIDDLAFMNTSKLVEITVDSSNTNYVAQNGVLFTYDMSALVQYPIGKLESHYDVPSSVTSICGGAFAGNNSLSSISLSSNLTSIGQRAFSYCTGIKEIVIPSKVTSFGANAFEYSGLETITIEAKRPENYENGWSYYWNLYTDASIKWNNQ